jgi:hypothetical protein
LHIICINSGFFRMIIFPIYNMMRSTMIFGTSGGPGLYVLAYALADFDNLALWEVPSSPSATRAALRMSDCSFY